MPGLATTAGFKGFSRPALQLEGGAGSQGEPNIPDDSTAGIPCATMLGWCNEEIADKDQAYYSLWKSRGWGAFYVDRNYLKDFGGDQTFKGSSAAGLGNEYRIQKKLEPSGGNRAALAAAVGVEFAIGCRFTSNTFAFTDYPPYGDWFNDTTWTNVVAQFAEWAEFCEYCGVPNFVLDLEYTQNGWKADGYAGDTHTAAENRAKARQRGAELGVALWTASPTLRLFIYEAFIPDGWVDEVQTNLGNPNHLDPYTRQDWLAGLFEGMQTAGGAGEIVLADHYFYRTPSQTYGGSASYASAYKIDSQEMRAWLSTYFGQALWSFAADKLKVAGFTWRGKDTNQFYVDTYPTDASWSTMLLEAHNRSEGTHRMEFVYDAPDGTRHPGHSAFHYGSATCIAGAQAAADTTPLDTAPPTLADLAADETAGTVTITCTASHLAGIERIDIHEGATYDAENEAASKLGTMTMTPWNRSTGTVATNFDAAYQECSFSTPGAVDDWFVAKEVSIHGDIHYDAVQVV